VETYTTTGEHRQLSVELWYPQGAHGTYPLIVFSHGGMATKSSNTSLYNELASHGYVVAAVDHTYQALFTTVADGHTAWMDPGYAKEFALEDAHSNRQAAYLLYQKWMQLRMGDLNFVIDTILAKVRAGDPGPGYALVDATKLGVMGHSLGGSAALGIGRTRSDVGAVIALESPFLNDITGTNNGEFVWDPTPYPVPLLDVYSDTSWGRLGELTQYAENAALLTNPPATAFTVSISGANHLSLTDLGLVSPFLTAALSGSPSTRDATSCLTIVNKVTLAFFDSYLKGTGRFAAAGRY
jgi:dienelactone hydrolase